MNRKSATEQELRAYSLEMDKQEEADVMNWLAWTHPGKTWEEYEATFTHPKL